MRGLRGLGIQGLANPVFSAGCPGGGLMSTILSYNPIAYWPLNELSGTAAINYGSLGTAANGTYSGATLAQIAVPGGGLAPYFNGASAYANIYTAALSAAFNGQAGCALIYSKAYDNSVWTDAANRRRLQIAGTAGAEFVVLMKNTSNSDIDYYKAGGVTESYTTNDYKDTNWHINVITWSKIADEVKYYVDGVYKETDTVLGAWGAVALDSGSCAIGSLSTTAPTQFWYGYLAHCAIYINALTAEQIATIIA